MGPFGCAERAGRGAGRPQPTDLPVKHADACGVPEFSGNRWSWRYEKRSTKGPRQPRSQLIFRPLQSGSDFVSSDREFRMITLVREHFGRYGNCVVADTKWPYDFTNGNGLPGVNANLGYVANRFSVAGDERQSDKAFVYLRRCWMLLADDLRCSRRCPNKQDNKRNYGCFRHGFVSFRHVFSSQLLFQAPGSAIFNGICLAIPFHSARTPLTRSQRDPRCSHGRSGAQWSLC